MLKILGCAVFVCALFSGVGGLLLQQKPVGSRPSMPAAGSLIGQYLLTEGAGVIAHDSSGMGNDASIHGATWEAAVDLNFTASGQYMQLPPALNAARTFQFAFYEPPLGFSQLPLAPGIGDASSIPANASLLCGSDKNHLCIIPGVPSNATGRFQANTDGTEAGVAMTPGWHVLSYLCGSKGDGVVAKSHILYDGAEVSSYIFQGDAGTCPVPTQGNYQIGGSASYYQTWFIGRLAAAWAWNTELSVADASTAAKTGLAYMHSKGVPQHYANAGNAAPLVLAGVDSRTLGEGLSSSTLTWPSVMKLDRPMQRRNLAASGSQMYDWCYEYDLVYGQQIPLVHGGVVISALWGGFNDIFVGRQTIAQLTSSLQCVVKAAKAHGTLVVLATETSSAGGKPEGDQYKNAITTIIRANAYAWGVDTIADLATDPLLGADGASKNATYFPDNTHPSAAGHARIAAIFANAIDELTGATAAAPHSSAVASYQEVAGDRYLNLTAGTQQTVTLPGCVGYSLPRFITNRGYVAATVGTLNGEMLAWSRSVEAGATAGFTPVPGALATGGCSWNRTQ